jgi:acetylornithine aminotransferase
MYLMTGMHGTTFGGSPLACAIGYHVLSRLSDNGFLSRSVETGSYLYKRLSQLPEWFPNLISPGVRGRGFILGLGFKDEPSPSKLVGLARERGVLLLTAGKDAVRIVPSLNIGTEEVNHAVDVIESCLHVMNQ